ncbi:MAG TPA: hypothetical protein ENI19_01105 [Candidatus Nealsonbacteria bacterium]|nr:hypothetical protein [Candidatus Nealsonbacteria bacterium]HEB46291.1 hypothetical protein [Candidatus Nealsonbacteria bacterium]
MATNQLHPFKPLNEIFLYYGTRKSVHSQLGGGEYDGNKEYIEGYYNVFKELARKTLHNV